MKFVWEHNGDDTLLYSVDFIGAFARGESFEKAAAKLPAEIAAYARWAGLEFEKDFEVEIVQEKESDLQIADADSDVIFDAELEKLTLAEYEKLKALVLKSAMDFHEMYMSVADGHKSCLPARKTFYGNVPRTAQEMYEHTKSVNSYYFAEVDVDADNEGSIYECRKRGFELLEKKPGFLEAAAVEGSYGEMWSLRKMLRRFIWHDRIHARAMYRMAVKTFGRNGVRNVFCFDI